MFRVWRRDYQQYVIACFAEIKIKEPNGSFFIREISCFCPASHNTSHIAGPLLIKLLLGNRSYRRDRFLADRLVFCLVLMYQICSHQLRCVFYDKFSASLHSSSLDFDPVKEKVSQSAAQNCHASATSAKTAPIIGAQMTRYSGASEGEL